MTIDRRARKWLNENLENFYGDNDPRLESLSTLIDDICRDREELLRHDLNIATGDAVSLLRAVNVKEQERWRHRVPLQAWADSYATGGSAKERDDRLWRACMEDLQMRVPLSRSVACCNPMSSAPCACRTAGAKQEREKTVAWLREYASAVEKLPGEYHEALRSAADAIERGETDDASVPNGRAPDGAEVGSNASSKGVRPVSKDRARGGVDGGERDRSVAGNAEVGAPPWMDRAVNTALANAYALRYSNGNETSERAMSEDFLLLIKQVREHEREACAKLCDENRSYHDKMIRTGGLAESAICMHEGAENTAKHLAYLIRSRSKETK